MAHATATQSGSMMQISEMVLEKGYEVIILNSNANFWYNGRANLTAQTHTGVAVTVPGKEIEAAARGLLQVGNATHGVY